MFLDIMMLIAGLVLLVFAGDYLVKGAVGLAENLGIPSLIIGLTIVAFGTSAPELVISLSSALGGAPDIAMGNVVGSNVFNLLLIGGATMAITPTPIPADLLDFEWPVLAATAVMLLLLCRYAKGIGRGLGAVLVGAFALNTVILFA